MSVMLAERLLINSEVALNGCRLWSKSTMRNGYGQIRLSQPRRLEGVHRVAFEIWVRPLLPGEVVDHDCHNGTDCPGGWSCIHRPCIEPTHLVGRTHRQNILLGKGPSALNALVETCPQGHDYTLENTYWWKNKRQCVTCRALRDAARYHHS